MKNEKINSTIKSNKMILIGLGIGIVFWILESVLHFLVFDPDGAGWEILSLDPHELSIRSLLLGLFVIFGIYAQITVTKQKQTEKQIQRAKEDWERTFNAIDDVITIQDTEMRVRRMNRKAVQVLNYGKEEALGKHCYELFQGTSGPCPGCPKSQTMQKQAASTAEIEYPRLGKTFLVKTAPIFSDNGTFKGIVHLARDITEQKKIEAQYRQAQKMEAVGTLAGGIAHDFSNLLQVVQGYAELILGDRNKEDPDYSQLQVIMHEAIKGGELVQQLLTFSRKVESRLRPVALNHKVEQIRKLLSRTIPKMIEVELCLAGDLGVVYADPAQIEQILLNLAVNARDAMPEGGRLIIETENVLIDEDYCNTHPGAKPGNYVLLGISDSGQGMDRKALQHIFEPFYTTKEIGRGTGLGLAMVYGIVKSHNGYITCDSEPGEGTTFKIYLPVIEQKREDVELDESEVAIKGGAETILLVDDDESIRNFGKELLGKYGYTVLTAVDGENALDIYEREKEHIDLVVLDLMMPGMGGRRCLEALLNMNPQIRIIIASGYSPNLQTKEIIEAKAKSYIQKPYGIKKMLEEVREVLVEENLYASVVN